MRFSKAQAWGRKVPVMPRRPHALTFALALIAGVPSALHAQPEDAEHRADRLRTIELNRGAQGVVNRRDRSNADVRMANRKAMERYEKQRAAWREQVQACRSGDWGACERR
ncbi:hypothetical protein [Rhizorhabdus sp.]|uniref:hypothetical protein n=1 Tax=Rhizorhabdus sp. TaxID=1968843 RepID=UPI0019910D93|nr:hypothetical protein [Rhizorhabdus sp.]MBD3762802.1 hypothetical protein [Rhizorhabdus sp.]